MITQAHLGITPDSEAVERLQQDLVAQMGVLRGLGDQFAVLLGDIDPQPQPRLTTAPTLRDVVRHSGDDHSSRSSHARGPCATPAGVKS